MRQLFLITGIVLGFLITIVSTPASAFGFVAAQVHYSSGSNSHAGIPVVVHQYPNGRVVVQRIPVVHVYPNGESLIYQNGGERVYATGFGGPSTCYVSCWHNGVNPNRSGSSWSVGIGAHKTW